MYRLGRGLSSEIAARARSATAVLLQHQSTHQGQTFALACVPRKHFSSSSKMLGAASPSPAGTPGRKAPEAVQSSGKTKDGRNLRIRQYPKHETLEEEREYRKQHLAGAFRIFADRGYDEGVAGHISVRDPILTDHFCRSHTSFSIQTVPKNVLTNTNKG